MCWCNHTHTVRCIYLTQAVVSALQHPAVCFKMMLGISILAFECVLIKTTGEKLPKKTFKHKYASFAGMLFGYSIDVKTVFFIQLSAFTSSQ